MKVPLNLYVEYEVKLELQKRANESSDGNISKYVSEFIKPKNPEPIQSEGVEKKERKKSNNDSVKQIFDYFNEQVAINFKPENKLRILTSERERVIKNLLAAFSLEEIKQGILGFLAARKEAINLKENYLDFRYLVKNFESYLAKGTEKGLPVKKVATEAEKERGRLKMEENYQKFLQEEVRKRELESQEMELV